MHKTIGIMSNGRKFHRNIEAETLFESEMTLSELMKLGNPLEYLDRVVDFEVFRPTLEESLVNNSEKTMLAAVPLTRFLSSRPSFFSGCTA